MDFRSGAQLAEATLRIVDDPVLKRILEENAYSYGRETAWPRVGERMLSILRAAVVHPCASIRVRAPLLPGPVSHPPVPAGPPHPAPVRLPHSPAPASTPHRPAPAGAPRRPFIGSRGGFKP